MCNTESISIKEAALRMGKGTDFVRNAIIQGTMPGSYKKTVNGVSDFHIPRAAFEDYMLYWRPVMTKDIALAIIEAISGANLNVKKPLQRTTTNQIRASKL